MFHAGPITGQAILFWDIGLDQPSHFTRGGEGRFAGMAEFIDEGAEPA